ncbi:MAG: hypothetical protein ACYC35_12100 [Pirellulales bacterium]
MEIDQDRIYAVISGDIIGSSTLSPSERAELPNMMKQASNELRTFLAESVPLSVDIYAGDSWQLLVSEPGDALKAALFYRSSIIAATAKKVDTRLAVALGKVDFIPGERASEGDGEAFRLSGRALTETASKQQLRFVMDQAEDSDSWDATFGLMDVVVRRWSAKQAQAVVGAVQGWSHAEIAAHCKPPIQRESVTRLLATANWHAIDRVVEVFKSRFSASNG